MTDNDGLPLAQRIDILARKVPNRIALRCVQVDAAKTILMLQSHADRAKFRNRQTDEDRQILELVLKRKAELAALDQDNGE